jgi:4-aminobutyrate aminotransferase
MPSLTTAPDAHIRLLPAAKQGLPITTTTQGLQDIAHNHITKGLGRLRDHVFKEGKGLRVLTTVSASIARADFRTAASCSTLRLVSE